MLPRLSAEESLRTVSEVGIAFGSGKEEERTAMVDKWATTAGVDRTRRASSAKPQPRHSPERLHVFGIGLRKATKKSPQ